MDDVERLPHPSLGPFTHTRSCPQLTPASDDRCTCGLQYRILAGTERTMHAAWRKRAEEAEVALTARGQEVAALKVALRNLTFAARTSGGTAGRDDELCAACDAAESALAALQSGERPEQQTTGK